MKKRISALTILIFFASAPLVAQQRTLVEARDIAVQFFESQGSMMDDMTDGKQATVNEARRRTGADSSTHSPAYYIFNNASQGGYVIIGADSRFRPILGYRPTGSFSEDSIPDGLRYWLQFLTDEMAATAACYDSLDTGGLWAGLGNPLPMGAGRGGASPLLSSHWSQTTPFNQQVPVTLTGSNVSSIYEGHAAVGCVATAIGQLMNYWKYPQRGQGGTHTNNNYTGATVNFSQQTYNWDDILDNYGYYYAETGGGSVTRYAQHTAGQDSEVAKLCYHLGVAVDMVWNSDGKGTSTAVNAKALSALTTYFGYNRHARMQPRRTLSLRAFRDLLTAELNAGRPVLFSGMSDNPDNLVGHFFVLDGYDAATDLFHINWGWMGLYDGYYALSALNPGTGGVGAGAGSYNYNQNAIIGLQPTEVAMDYEPAISFDHAEPQPKTVARGTRTDLTVYDVKCEEPDFQGSYGLAIYSTAGQYETGSFQALPEMQPGVTFGYITFYTPTFNKAVPIGQHIMRLAARSADGTVYPLHATYGNAESWLLDVTAGKTSRDPGLVTITPITPSDPSDTAIREIPSTATSSTLLTTQYYTLSGQPTRFQPHTLLIQKETYTDGSVRVRKVYR